MTCGSSRDYSRETASVLPWRPSLIYFLFLGQSKVESLLSLIAWAHYACVLGVYRLTQDALLEEGAAVGLLCVVALVAGVRIEPIRGCGDA